MQGLDSDALRVKTLWSHCSPKNLEFQTIICPVTVIGRDAQGCPALPGGDLAICELCPSHTFAPPPSIVCSFCFPSPQPQRVRIGKEGGKKSTLGQIIQDQHWSWLYPCIRIVRKATQPSYTLGDRVHSSFFATATEANLDQFWLRFFWQKVGQYGFAEILFFAAVAAL